MFTCKVIPAVLNYLLETTRDSSSHPTLVEQVSNFTCSLTNYDRELNDVWTHSFY